MPKAKTINRKTIVREHLMHVPPSKKNPTGVTTRHTHLRRIHESLGIEDLMRIFKEYNKKKIKFPASGKLTEFKNSDDYDDLIAVWCDYFNQKFPPVPPRMPVDPDVLKALIASESGFDLNPKNPKAIGIAQITKATLKILLEPDGEAKEFTFKNLRQKDLKDPDVAIALAARWLLRKKDMAAGKLGREPTHEEIILEYKGLLKSSSTYKERAILNYRDAYTKLTGK